MLSTKTQSNYVKANRHRNKLTIILTMTWINDLNVLACTNYIIHNKLDQFTCIKTTKLHAVCLWLKWFNDKNENENWFSIHLTLFITMEMY